MKPYCVVKTAWQTDVWLIWDRLQGCNRLGVSAEFVNKRFMVAEFPGLEVPDEEIASVGGGYDVLMNDTYEHICDEVIAA